MLDQYEVEINGRFTTLQLTEEDAKERGLKKSDTVAARAEAAKEAAESKARAEAEAQRLADEAKAKAEADAKTAATPANKGRAPANKSAGADEK